MGANPLASRRSGNSLMMRSRSLSANDPHWAISPSVRPQPRHSPDRGSIVQTLLQGDAIGIGSLLRIRREHKARRPEGNENR
jgi:hypothetical protein